MAAPHGLALRAMVHGSWLMGVRHDHTADEGKSAAAWQLSTHLLSKMSTYCSAYHVPILTYPTQFSQRLTALLSPAVHPGTPGVRL